MTDIECLYDRLEALSKCLESSGRIDQHEMPDAYATLLDAMKLVREGNPMRFAIVAHPEDTTLLNALPNGQWVILRRKPSSAAQDMAKAMHDKLASGDNLGLDLT